MDLQLHFMILITMLSDQEFTQFSVHLSTPYFISLSMSMLWETESKESLKAKLTIFTVPTLSTKLVVSLWKVS